MLRWVGYALGIRHVGGSSISTFANGYKEIFGEELSYFIVMFAFQMRLTMTFSFLWICKCGSKSIDI